MPELPEVETVRRDLHKYVVGKHVRKIIIKKDFVKKIFPSRGKFIKFLENKSLKSVDRVGKLLILDFGENLKLLAHLKMTGQFVFVPPMGDIVAGGHPVDQTRENPDRFNRVIFDFGENGILYFNDLRKFGFLKLVDDQTANLEKERYGIEPIAKGFTFKIFNNLLEKKKSLEIKKFLLMQNLIAGIGNIYADESCFAANILGTRKIKDLTLEQRKNLYQALKTILNKAVLHRGTSVRNYVDGEGKKGGYVKFLKVYGRVGKKCLKCKKATILKTKIGGRGTSYCPNCQD